MSSTLCIHNEGFLTIIVASKFTTDTNHSLEPGVYRDVKKARSHQLCKGGGVCVGVRVQYGVSNKSQSIDLLQQN